MTGVIDRFNYEKLYGFILGDDGQEYFFSSADFSNNPKKIKGRHVRFNVDRSSQSLEGEHYRAINICTLSRDTITVNAILDIESGDPYPQDIGIALQDVLNKEIDKYRTIEGTKITGTVSVGRKI